MKILLQAALFLSSLCACAQNGSFPYPPVMAGAKVEVYKTPGDVRLSLDIFNPPNHQPADRQPAIVFFFGGGWANGSPDQFETQCRWLASRGMVAISAGYRVSNRQHSTAAAPGIIHLDLPLNFRAQPIDDQHPERVALMYGPQMMVAVNPAANLHETLLTLPGSPRPIDYRPSAFSLDTPSRPAEIVPFHAVRDEIYTTYFRRA